MSATARPESGGWGWVGVAREHFPAKGGAHGARCHPLSNPIGDRSGPNTWCHTARDAGTGSQHNHRDAQGAVRAALGGIDRGYPPRLFGGASTALSGDAKPCAQIGLNLISRALSLIFGLHTIHKEPNRLAHQFEAANTRCGWLVLIVNDPL